MSVGVLNSGVLSSFGAINMEIASPISSADFGESPPVNTACLFGCAFLDAPLLDMLLLDAPLLDVVALIALGWHYSELH